MGTQRKPLKNQSKPKLKKPAKTTLREKKLIQGIVVGKTKRQAATDAGYTGTPETISVTASKVLKKAKVQEELEKAFERHGITIDRVIQPISEGLDATKTIVMGKDEDSFVDMQPDHAVRLKASGMALDLMGVKREQAAGTVNNFIIVTEQQKAKYGI